MVLNTVGVGTGLAGLAACVLISQLIKWLHTPQQTGTGLGRMWQGLMGRSIGLMWVTLMVLSHQSKTTTRQRQDKCWTCAFLLCLSHQVRQTWCERHNRNAQVQLLSCRCLVVVLLWCESTITVGSGLCWYHVFTQTTNIYYLPSI